MKIDPTRIQISVAPAAEPVSLAEAKNHLRIDHSDDNAMIARLLGAARLQCEDEARRPFITRTYVGKADGWPGDGRFELPWPPLVAVSSITYTDEDGVTSTFASSNYVVDSHSEPGRIVLKRASVWPGETLQEVNGVTVTWTAGYGPHAQHVPDRYRQAILLVVGHLYENRESVVVGQGITLMALPQGVGDLLWRDRGAW